MTNPSNIIILDPQLEGVGGHYFTLDTLLAEECRNRNIPVEVYGRVGSNIESLHAEFKPVFRYNIFDEMKTSTSFGVFENLYLMNQLFFEDLQKIDIEKISANTIVYFPNLIQNQLDSIADWIVSIPELKRPSVVITLRWLNSRLAYNADRGYEKAIEFIYALGIRKLKTRHARTYFFSDTQTLAAKYAEISGIEVLVHPVPQADCGDINEAEPEVIPSKISVVYLGTASPIRGFHLLPRIIRQVLSETDNVKFVIQNPKDNPVEPVRLAADAIKNMAGEFVTVLDQTLSVDDYQKVLNEADIILLPYDQKFYEYGSSGVFTEAACLGKIIITTAGTVQEQVAKQNGLACIVTNIFEAYTFAEGIKMAVMNFPEYRKIANFSAKKFRSENSPKSFWDNIFFCVNN
jgi:glycosyltransferase involved in cell wall biosynthesis